MEAHVWQCSGSRYTPWEREKACSLLDKADSLLKEPERNRHQLIQCKSLAALSLLPVVVDKGAGPAVIFIMKALNCDGPKHSDEFREELELPFEGAWDKSKYWCSVDYDQPREILNWSEYAREECDNKPYEPPSTTVKEEFLVLTSAGNSTAFSLFSAKTLGHTYCSDHIWTGATKDSPIPITSDLQNVPALLSYTPPETVWEYIFLMRDKGFFLRVANLSNSAGHELKDCLQKIAKHQQGWFRCLRAGQIMCACYHARALIAACTQHDEVRHLLPDHSDARQLSGKKFYVLREDWSHETEWQEHCRIQVWLQNRAVLGEKLEKEIKANSDDDLAWMKYLALKSMSIEQKGSADEVYERVPAGKTRIAKRDMNVH